MIATAEALFIEGVPETAEEAKQLCLTSMEDSNEGRNCVTHEE